MLPLVLAAAAMAAALQQAPAPRRPAPRPAAPRPAPPRTLTLTGPCAVLFRPDAAKLRQARQRGGEEFEFVAEDGRYYQAQARQYLRQRGIRVVETEQRRVVFAPPQGAPYAVDLSGPAHGWGLLLFDGQRRPRPADLTDPAPEVQAVLGK